MATITLRSAKGSPLTNAEVDDNFSNLNTELGQKESASNKGQASGYASLDGSGKVPASQLPSYVDDVVEAANFLSLPGTGETGKIYVVLDTNKTYRWSGSAYVEISASPGSTDAVTEGSTNLYFTNARARSAISASGSLSYNSSTGVLSYTAPTAVSQLSNDSGYITSSALSPYLTSATAASTYQTALVSGTSIKTVNGNSVLGSGNIQIDGGVTSFNTRTGAVTLSSGDVTTALGYTPYNSSNPSGYLTDAMRNRGSVAQASVDTATLDGFYTQNNSGDSSGLLVFNAGGSLGPLQMRFTYGGTFEFRNKTDSSTWTSWKTVAHSGNFTGFSLSSGQVTTALGYTPYNSTNPNGYITSASLSSYLPLSGGTLTGTLYFTDTTNGFSKLSSRLSVRSESTDNVAEFASYGMYLPKTGQTAGLYIESPIEARGGLRIGNGAGSGTITVGADTAATANRLVQRDSGGDIYGRYFFGVHFNQSSSNTENPSIAAFWTNSGSDNYNRKSSPAHVISQLGLLTTSNYTSYSPSLTGSGASGTWSISITGSAGSASNSTTVGGLAPAQFFNNMGNNHSTYTDFNNVPGFGAYYVQQGGNSPTGTANHQWYGFTLGLGNDYALGSYGSQIYYPRRAQNSDTYIYVRDREGGSWTSWTKIKAGYADTAGSVAGALANGSGGITIGNASASEVDVAYSSSDGTWQVGTNNYYGTNSFFWYRDGTGYRAGLDQSANMFVGGSSRAPIFYDYDNTGYYCDPASSSRLNVIYCGDVYNDLGGWFRNYGATGIYNQSYGNHFYSDSTNYWNVSLGGSGAGGIRIRDNHAGTIRGYLYADNSNHIGFLNNGGSWRARVVAGDYFLIEGSSIRAPLYYDSNDTGYYFRPASTDTGLLRGRLTFGDYGAGIVGTYSSYRYQLVYAMGAAYQGALDGTSVSSGYGLWYSHPNAGGVASNLSSHGLMNIVNGSFNASLDASMRAVTDMRSPIYYDIGNTGYYVDAASTSYLYHLILSGASYFRPSNWIQLDGIYGLYWPNHYGLHVRANDQSTYTQLCIQGSKNSYGGILDLYSSVNGMMYDSGGNGGVYREGNGRWYFYHHVGNNCMGVGTSTTSSSYYMYVGGGIYATGNVVAYSDARKKTNVVTVDSALDTVSKLRGVFYNRIADGDPDIDTERREIGVIAQEVNEVLPEVVTYAADVDEYGVQYGNFAGLFIEAFKELRSEVKALRAEVQELRGRLGE